MSIKEQVRQVGDTATAIAGTLTRPDGTVVDVTSLTVKFVMIHINGTVKVAETSSFVTKTDAPAGDVQYTCQAADVDTPGTYNAYFVTEAGTGEQDTFPVDEGHLRIIIKSQA